MPFGSKQLVFRFRVITDIKASLSDTCQRSPAPKFQKLSVGFCSFIEISVYWQRNTNILLCVSPYSMSSAENTIIHHTSAGITQQPPVLTIFTLKAAGFSSLINHSIFHFNLQLCNSSRITPICNWSLKQLFIAIRKWQQNSCWKEIADSVEARKPHLKAKRTIK